MQPSHPQHPTTETSLWRRLDRAMGAMNAYLIALAIGLMVLDVSCFTAIKIAQLPALQVDDGGPAQQPAAR